MLIDLYKRHTIRVSLSLAILAFFLLHVAGVYKMAPLDALELFAYDQRLNFMTTKEKDDRVVILDIDEQSLAAEGRWPWSRDRLAQLVDMLFDHYGISILGFDVVFAERDESSGLKILEQLARAELRDQPTFAEQVEELRPKLDYDGRFAASLKDRAVVLGYVFHEGQSTEAGVVPPPVLEADAFEGRTVQFRKALGFAGNLASLQEAAAAAGHFNPTIDPDGVVRRVPMLFEFEGAYYESLSLAVARTTLGIDNIQPGFVTGTKPGSRYSGLEWLELGNRRIPVDQNVQALVPYRGPQGSFPYVPATDVLHGRVDKDQLQGRIVLVGTTAPGLLDLRATPVQEKFAGVEIHANLIAGILDNALKDNPAYTLGAEFVLVTLSGLFMALLLPLLSPLWGTIATVLLLGAVVVTNMVIWQWQNLVLPLASGIVILFVMYLFSMTYALFVETRGKRQLAGLFGQYVPPELVDEMSENPGSFSLEGESREMTVLFSDVRSFTTISEGLDPRTLSQLMNEYLTPMTRIIHDHRGTIDKYMGDAIMAFWGAPLDDPEHARNALEAALEMLEELGEIQTRFGERGWPPIRIGIGLNTGYMNVGNMGSEFRMAYTVLGDAVNLGSRLEGLTKSYGIELIVSETTAEAVPEFLYRELDRVRVKGKDKPVTIYQPVGPRKQVEKRDRDEVKLHEEALKHYRAQNWDMAELQFLNLQKAHPDRALYPLYAQRIAHFRKEPPEEAWDGVFTYETK